MESPNRILIIRRDNIGDLVCTLPMLQRLREQYPDAWIGALVTRYNAEVLQGHPDLDAVFTYTKAKHLEAGESRIKAFFDRIKTLLHLRSANLDLILLPAGGEQASARRMAKFIGAGRILSQDDVTQAANGSHEVERTANILRALDINTDRLPTARIVPREEIAAHARAHLQSGSGPMLGIHISSRKPSQRWASESFIATLKALHAQRPDWRFALFWSPGDSDNPLHPGDDPRARYIMEACRELPLRPFPTHSLADLIAGLSVCDRVLCSDGGHMHLAAALGKPIVCLFGKSDATRWHPWQVPYCLFQPASEDVRDVGIEEVVSALQAL